MSRPAFLSGLRPSAMRAISLLCERMRRRRPIALYLGAGFDRIVTGGSAPGWAELVARIGGDACRAYAEQWPTEMAAYGTARIGNMECVDAFDSAMHASVHPLELGCLVPIIDRVAIVVTTNYSEWVLRAVRAALDALSGRPRRLAVFCREDLAAFRAPSTDELYVIYLHGRTSSGSTPVFDAWGYNVVRNDDPHYQLVLDGLLADYDVLTIGTSWSDVPLRDAAAKVLRQRRGARRAHLNPDWCERAVPWCNAMRICYGVETIPPANPPGRVPDFITALDDLAQRDLPPSPQDPAARDDRTAYLRSIAEYLDDQGDYESIGHHCWVFTAPAPSTIPGRSTTPVKSQWTIAQNNLRAMLTALQDHVDVDWHVVARIERHLRHHVYMYLHRERGSLLLLWERLIHQARADPDRLDDRLRFDLWLGAYELASGDPASVTAAEPLARHPRGKLGLRYQMAPDIWPPRGARTLSPEEVATRVGELIDGGWESGAAKLSLDYATRAIAHRLDAPLPTPFSLAERDRLEQASMLARLSGCYRREIKADILRALWLDAPDVGRARLFGYARSVDSDSVPLIEPSLLVGLAVAIAVCTSRLIAPSPAPTGPSSPRSGRTVLEAHDIIREVVTGLHVLDDDQIREQVAYWRERYVHVVDRDRINWP
jgi:hypothetical protein